MARLTEVGAQRPANATAGGDPGGSSGIDVLIVADIYDGDVMAHALIEQVSPERINVVNDGEQGLDFLFGQGAYATRDPTQIPRLILLDLHLPGIGSLEVLRLERGRHIGVRHAA